MPIVRIDNTGGVGMIRDVSPHELPLNAWTLVRNIRFRDRRAERAPGYLEMFSAIAQTGEAPQFLHPSKKAPALIYAGATKIYAATFTAGAFVHTDLTHATPRTGVVNEWTSCSLSGIPILNSGASAHAPMYWDLNLANNFVDLSNWPASTTCEVIRNFKNILIALDLTKSGTNYPYMVKWSSPADPGALPATWDETDATQLAGEFDIAEGDDTIVDGMQLRESFVVYKQNSIWRMDFVGAPTVFSLNKIAQGNGPMSKNCIAEVGWKHAVFGHTDLVIHDGQEFKSILKGKARIDLYARINNDKKNLCYCFYNTFSDEVWFCFPNGDAQSCDLALVYNVTDETISLRDLVTSNHALCGPLWPEFRTSWDSDTDPWDSDLSAWNGLYGPGNLSVPMSASANGKVYALDITLAYGSETAPTIFAERRGFSFGKPEKIKLIRGIRARITGDVGKTVLVKVGGADDPYEDPTYGSETEYVIGTTIANDCLVTSRYPAIRFESGTAFDWKLDSYDVDVEEAGLW